MRNAVFVVLGLVVLWAVVGGPGVDVRSPTPSEQIPTFEQKIADREEIEMAYDDGRLVEDPNRREARQAVIDAWDMLEYSPCDEDLKSAFRTAVRRFFEGSMDSSRSSSETIEVDGRVIDGSGFFSAAAWESIQDGAMAGHLRPEDLSRRYAIMKKLAPNMMARMEMPGLGRRQPDCE